LSRPLPAIPTTTLTFADGRFGQDSGPLRSWPQTLLIDAQWGLLALGALAWVLAGPREKRFPKRLRGWIGAAAGLVGLLLVGVIGSALYELPLLTVIPPEQIAGGLASQIPTPDPATLKTPEQVALATRGRYIFTIASCALCHGADGSGGLKVSWKPM